MTTTTDLTRLVFEWKDRETERIRRDLKAGKYRGKLSLYNRDLNLVYFEGMRMWREIEDVANQLRELDVRIRIQLEELRGLTVLEGGAHE